MPDEAPNTEDELPEDYDELQFAKDVLAMIKKHAEELRAKGLPVDDMIRDIEAKIAAAVAAAQELEDLKAEDDLLTRKRQQLRRDVDEITKGLPVDLVDGMATIAYLHGITERHEARRRRGPRARGG